MEMLAIVQNNNYDVLEESLTDYSICRLEQQR